MESLEKEGGGRIKGGKGKGEREGAWWEDQGVKKGKRRGKVVGGLWLVTYLTCTSLPLIPYEMRYMSMIMSMNMNTYLMRMSRSLVVQYKYSLLGFFLLLYDRYM